MNSKSSMAFITRLDMMENAVKVLEEKNRCFQQRRKKPVEQDIVYDNKSSFSLENNAVRDNLEIPYLRQNISNDGTLIKYDNSLVKGSRNPLILVRDEAVFISANQIRAF